MLDVDGTTVPNRPDGMPSKKVTEAIAKAKDKIYIGLITGRPIYNVLHIYKHLELSGPLVLLGGAQIIEPKTGHLLYERVIEKKDILLLCNMLKQLDIIFYIDEKDRSYKYTQSYIPHTPCTLLVEDVLPHLADQIIQEITISMPHIQTHKLVSYTHGRICITIAHAEATKQHAIWEVAKILQIHTEEIIAVGDGYNDFPFFMACGLKVAMGNAVDELKAIADYIAPTVDEDGIVDVIERFVL